MRGEPVRSAEVLVEVMTRCLAEIGGTDMAPNFTHAGFHGVVSRENQEARAVRARRALFTVENLLTVAALALAATLAVAGY